MKTLRSFNLVVAGAAILVTTGLQGSTQARIRERESNRNCVSEKQLVPPNELSGVETRVRVEDSTRSSIDERSTRDVLKVNKNGNATSLRLLVRSRGNEWPSARNSNQRAGYWGRERVFDDSRTENSNQSG
jgi:hypothetical protein